MPIKLPTIQEVYGAPPKPSVKATKLPSMADLQLEGTEGLTGIQEGYNFHDYKFQPKLGQNNDLIRAQRQGWFEQLYKTVGNTAANAVTGLVETVGYAGEMFDPSQDYNNWLIDAMESMKNPFGEVYRLHPEKTFDLGDSAWWFNNFGQLVESAASFAVPGGIEGKLAQSLFEGIGTLAKVGRTGMNIARGTAALLTAGHLAYVEGAMSGRQIYKEIYDAQFDKAVKQGMNAEQAHEHANQLASHGAATTVRTNVLMNTALNLIEIAPMFRHGEEEVERWWRTEGRRLPGEERAAWKARINAAAENSPALKRALHGPGIGHEIVNAISEGVEEVNTQYAEQTGREEGKTRAKTNMDFLSDYFDKIGNQEGLLNFALGAIGGIGQTALLENLPLHKVAKIDANGNAIPKAGEPGKYETRRISTKTRDDEGRSTYYNNIKDAVLKDIDWFEKNQKDLDAAVQNKNRVEAERIRAKMFSVHQMNAVQLGTAGNWTEEYKNIANLPQEEAIKRGYAVDEQDTRYKDRAARAIEDINWMSKLYEDLHHRYRDEANPRSHDLIGHIFNQETQQRLLKRILDEEENDINRDQKIMDVDRVFREKMSVHEQLAKELGTDSALLNHALQKGDIAEMKRLAAKYKTPVSRDTDLPAAMDTLMERINARVAAHNQSMAEAEAAMKDGVGFTQWKARNPKGTFQEFAEENRVDPYVQNRKLNLQRGREQWSISQEQLEDAKSAKGIKEFMTAAEENYKQWVASEEKNNKQRSEAVLERLYGKHVAAKLVLARSEKDLMDQEDQEKNHVKSINETKAYIAKWQQELAGLGEFKTLANPMKARKRKQLMQNIENAAKVIEDMQKTHMALQDAIQNAKVKVTAAKAKVEQTKEIVDPVDEEDEDTSPLESDSPVVKPAGVTTNTEPATATEPQTPPEVVPSGYEQLAGKLPQEVQNALDNLEVFQSVRMGAGQGYSYDLAMKTLKPLIDDQIISHDTAHNLIIEQKAELEGKSKKPPVVDTTPTPEPVASETSEPLRAEDIMPVGEPFTPPMATHSFDAETLVASDKAAHISAQSASAMKVNSASIEYMEVSKVVERTNEEGQKEKVTLYKYIPRYDRLDKNANHNVLKPGFVRAGDNVILRVDPSFSGVVNYDKTHVTDDFGYPDKRDENFAYHATPEGKIIMRGEADGYANVPIQIVHERSGEVIGYLARTDWVTAQYPGAGNYRNLVDDIKDAEGNIIERGNVEKQRKALLALRKKIAEAYNNGERDGMKTKVQERTSAGHFFYNIEVNANNETYKFVEKQASRTLLDKKLQFGMVNHGTVYVGAKTPFDGEANFNSKTLRNQLGNVTNRVVVLLPMPNGKHSVSPLNTIPLKGVADTNTVARAIEAYLAIHQKQGTEAHQRLVDKIREATEFRDKKGNATSRGLNILDPKDLERFINQYFTHTRHFKEVHTSEDFPVDKNGQKVPVFMLDIPSMRGTNPLVPIKIGTMYKPESLKKAELDGNGKLTKEFEDALIEGLGTHFKNVVYTREEDAIRGLNDPQPFHSVTVNKAGAITIKAYDNYNEYLKTFTTTVIDGTHRIDRDGKEIDSLTDPGNEKVKGTYVYGANSVINFDPAPIMKTPRIVQPSVTEIIPNVETLGDAHSVLVEAGSSDMWDELYDPDSAAEVVSGVGTVEDAPPATLENLRTLQANTPASDRNQKSPEEVLAEMHSQGITQIIPGYNPFKKC